MKRLPVVLFAMLFAVLTVFSACADGGTTFIAEVKPTPAVGYTVAANEWGLAIDKIATRCGPSTDYMELGTYKMKGKTLRVLSLCYDENDVAWVQCEVTYGGLKRRVYTGLKRFDTTTFNLNKVPEETYLDRTAIVMTKVTGRYGPGTSYGKQSSLEIAAGTEVQVLTTENGWAQIQFQTAEMTKICRTWVELDVLAYVNG